MPRKKGSKSKLGIPTRGLQEAVDLTKMAYNKAGDKSMSFSEIAEFMKLQKGVSTPTIGALKEYGLVEKSDLGWRISATGKNAIFGDAEAIKNLFMKNPVFADLYRRFGSKNVTHGIIEQHLRAKYRKGENVGLIVKRFVEGVSYIKGHKSGHISNGSEMQIENNTNHSHIIALIKLKYALNPPSKKEIHTIIDTLEEELKDEDKAITTLIKSIKENREKHDVAKILFDNLISIISAKYPFLIEEPDSEETTEESENGETNE